MGIAGHRIGRVIRLRTGDLDTFLDQARIEPGTPGTYTTQATTSEAARVDGPDSADRA